MRTKEATQTVTATSPAAAGTSAAPTAFTGGALVTADALVIDATLTGATGGTLDVYLQRKIAADTWRDWVHFPQVAAGASKAFSLVVRGNGTTIADVGGGSDASPTPSMAANAFANVIPGGDVRVVFVAGAGTSAGASQTIAITPYTERH